MTNPIQSNLRLSESFLDDDQTLEWAAWAVACARLGRPEEQLFAEELRPKDWKYARAALDAAKERLLTLEAERAAS